MSSLKRRMLGVWISGFITALIVQYSCGMWHVKGIVGRINEEKAAADNKWHHTSKVYDGKTVKMYIYGQLDGEASSGGTPRGFLMKLDSLPKF